jgi:hypothetical protein
VLIGALAALAEHGPGRVSVDARAFPRMHGVGWALASLAGGVAGSYLATSSPVSEPPEPAGEPTERFTRVEEPVHA